MQSIPLPCYLVPLKSKYPPQHPVLEHAQPTFLPQCERRNFTTIQNILLYNIIFIFLDRKPKDKRFYSAWLQAFREFSLLLICPWMQFRLFMLFPNIWTVELYLYLCCHFVLYASLQTWTHTYVFSAFTSKPISLLAITEDYVFFCIIYMLPPRILT